MPKLYLVSLSDQLPGSQLDPSADVTPGIDVHTLNKILDSNQFILRSSINLVGPTKSISILMRDENDDDLTQQQVDDLLQSIRQCGIACERLNVMETMSLDNEDHVDNEEHGHNEHHHDHNECHECGAPSEDAGVAEENQPIGSEHQQTLFSKASNRKSIKTIKKPHKHNHNHLIKGVLGTIWGLGLITLSILSLNIPALASYIITGATVLATLYLGKEAYIGGAKSLFKSKKLTMNTLYTISTMTIIAVSIASYFISGLPLMFEAAPLILGLWHIGEAIEHSLKEKVELNLDMRDCTPKKITWVNAKKNEQEYSVKNLIPNDIIIIRKGQVIPVDGECMDNNVTLYTHRIDGSPSPKLFYQDQPVLAGMQLTDEHESIRIRVKRTFQRSYLSRVSDNIKQAHQEKAPIEKITNKILKYFVPSLFAIAIISGITIGILFNPALAIQCAIAVLVSACPCALSLVTPLAVKIGMNKAAEHGINFKNGKELQAAASIDTVVFDLNGTLTEGKPQVTDYTIFDEAMSHNEDLFFQYIALLERHSAHPIAKVILEFIATRNLPTLSSLEMTDIDQSNHSGITAKIGGETVIVGNEKMLAENGFEINNPMPGAIYLVKGQSIIGKLSVIDPLRKDAKQAIIALKKQGKNIHLCTGADEPTAQHYATLLEIPPENVVSACLGTEKKDHIKKLCDEKYKVAMIGDAANDAAAMTQSHFGIAMKSSVGDEITQQQAGAVVQNELLRSIPRAFEVAQQTTRNIWQNLMMSLTYNTSVTLIAAGLLVAFGFALNPAIGIALMVLETTFVLANAYRFRKQSLSKLDDLPRHQSDQHEVQPAATSLARLSRPNAQNHATSSLKSITAPEFSSTGLQFFSEPSPSQINIPIANQGSGLFL